LPQRDGYVEGGWLGNPRSKWRKMMENDGKWRFIAGKIIELNDDPVNII
jgi:hypothetical protein